MSPFPKGAALVRAQLENGVLHMTLDEEERLEQLCPECRAQAGKSTCLCCGAPLAEVNSSFDEDRFEELRKQ